MAEARGQHRVADMLESAVLPGTTGSASALAEFRAVAAGFLASLRSVSAFDAMLPSMIQVPLRTRVVSTTYGGTAHSPLARAAQNP